MKAPRVTVLMPVFNGAKYLRPAIESILAQTCKDFEFLIVDDGSTDASREICREYRDSRIRLVENGGNLGLIATLNNALDRVRGEYIARMDCDDVSLPRRLERQLGFLERNPEVGLLGTWMERFWAGRSEIIEVPADDAAIRVMLAFGNTFGHNTMLMRRSVLERHGLRYDPAFKYAEDYEFWVRCARYTRLANLPEALLRYRFHPENTSNRFSREQGSAADRVRGLHLEALGVAVDAETLELHNSLMGFRFQGDIHRLERGGAWISELATRLAESLGVSAAAVHRALGRPWYGACGSLAHEGWRAWRLFRAFPMGRAAPWEWQRKLLVRCVLRKAIPAAVPEAEA